MKKIDLILGFVALALGVALIVFIVKFKKPAVLPPRGITLNDVTTGDADEMVADFKNNKKCEGKKTAVWVSKAWVDSVCAIVLKEHGDGIRLYFAKTLDTKKNTIVIVSTYKVGPDTAAESKSDHEDYYDHTESFFNSPSAVLVPDSAKDPGALLFDTMHCPCPTNTCFIAAPPNNQITCKNAYDAVQYFNKCGEEQEINTESEWFSLKVLQLIADDSKTNPKTSIDGIRIYFAKHTDLTTVNANHKQRHAFILIPTVAEYIGNTLYHKDYFNCRDKAYYPKLLKSMTDTGGGGDNGEQCLNNCSGVTLPAQ